MSTFQQCFTKVYTHKRHQLIKTHTLAVALAMAFVNKATISVWSLSTASNMGVQYPCEGGGWEGEERGEVGEERGEVGEGEKWEG